MNFSALLAHLGPLEVMSRETLSQDLTLTWVGPLLFLLCFTLASSKGTARKEQHFTLEKCCYSPYWLPILSVPRSQGRNHATVFFPPLSLTMRNDLLRDSSKDQMEFLHCISDVNLELEAKFLGTDFKDSNIRKVLVRPADLQQLFQIAFK